MLPNVLVHKKDGSLQFCMHYHKLSTCTHWDAYRLPWVQKSLMALCQTCYFSNLDPDSGYGQVLEQGKTVFVTQLRLFKFNLMPLGLSNAPSTFQ